MEPQCVRKGTGFIIEIGMNTEDPQHIYSLIQELAEKLQSAGVDLPHGLDTLLHTAAFPTNLAFDECQNTTSASSAQLGDPGPLADRVSFDLQDLIRKLPGVLPDEFTVSPADTGGQSAGKGLEFQDIYSIFLMTKFLDQHSPATLMRFEGVEDVDLMTRQDDRVCEWYYQIKTIKEGKNWTLRMFDTEGVWTRFARCVSEFHAKCSDPRRSLRVVFVVDGDVNAEVQVLRNDPLKFSISREGALADITSNPVFAKVRGEALSSIARRNLRMRCPRRRIREALESNDAGCVDQLRDLCCAVVSEADIEFATRLTESSNALAVDIILSLLGFRTKTENDRSNRKLETVNIPSLARTFIDTLESLAEYENYVEDLTSSLLEAYPLLDLLFSAMTIHSRIGFAAEKTDTQTPQAKSQLQDSFFVDSTSDDSRYTHLVWRSYLEEAILFRLIQHSHLSAEQARFVYNETLRPFVRTTAQTGGLLNSSLFVHLISSIRRVQLESLPDTTDLILRNDLVDEIIHRLDDVSGLYLHGFRKSGKTKLVAIVAHRLSALYAVFWHTATSGDDAAERLIGDLAYFCGEVSDRRNIYVDWTDRRLSLNAAACSIASAFQGHPILLVIDNWHLLSSSQMQSFGTLFETLTQSLGRDIKVLMVGEDRAHLPPFISADDAVRVRGLTVHESLSLLRQNDCRITKENYVEFLSLCTRIDGHPLMLQVAARELGRNPSANAVLALANTLPDLTQDTARFFDELTQRIYGILTTVEQKEVLQRLSVLFSRFDRDLCFRLAACEPRVQLKASDWRRLTAYVLDRSSDSHFVVPDLFRQTVVEDVPPDLRLKLHSTAADSILDTAMQRGHVDFDDFQNAVMYLGLAGRWQEAASRFLGIVVVSPSIAYDRLHLLYSIFRGPSFQAAQVDPVLRFGLAFSELAKLVRHNKVDDDSTRVLTILTQMRSAARDMEDERLRNIETCIYYLTTSSLYYRSLSTLVTAKQGSSTIERSSPAILSCAKRSLRRAKHAFYYSLRSEEPELLKAAFASVLDANYLVNVPSVDEIPVFMSRVVEDFSDGEGTSAVEPWDLWKHWESISNAYKSFGANHPDADFARLTLDAHLGYARDRGFSKLELIVHHAIAHWHFERRQEYDCVVGICNETVGAAKSLPNDPFLLQEAYTLRGDSWYALEDYDSARLDYSLAATTFKGVTSYTTMEIAIQSRLADSYWHLSNYRAAAAGYLRALRMRNRCLGYNQAKSFQLFGKLSLAYLSMGFYWDVIRLHEKMFALYHRFRDETMFLRLGGSIQGVLVELPGSPISDVDTMHREASAHPRRIGPRFYDATIATDNLQKWLDRVSDATFRQVLAYCYDLIGDTASAVVQAEASLHSDHQSSFIPVSVVRSSTYDLLSELHRKTGDFHASARAAFGSIALIEDFLASSTMPRATEAELFSDEYLSKLEEAREKWRRASPSDYAQAMFRYYLEPVILQQINTRRRFDDQLVYFLALPDMASRLPQSVRPCMEAWSQLYLGLFYLSRGYQQESKLAFIRMNDLISQYELLHVELVYLFHTTFGAAAILYKHADELVGAFTRMALRVIEILPQSEYLLADFNRQVVEIWCTKARISSDDSLFEQSTRLGDRLDNLTNRPVDARGKFFHICAVLLLWVMETDSWSADSRRLQEATLRAPLDQLATHDVFDLYEDFGAFARKEAQRHILDGNIETGQTLAGALHSIMSRALQYYGASLSAEQIDQLRDHQELGRMWSL